MFGTEIPDLDDSEMLDITRLPIATEPSTKTIPTEIT
jgi:hypothetical protein